MLDVCASFVTVDETDSVRFVHYTPQEYLLKNSIIPPDAGFKLAMVCTVFLPFAIFSGGACHHRGYKARIHSYPFLGYAAKHLSFHLQQCDETLTKELVLRSLGTPGSISSFCQALAPKRYFFELCRSPLHLVAQLRHYSTAQELVKNTDIMVLDYNEDTALSLAKIRTT